MSAPPMLARTVRFDTCDGNVQPKRADDALRDGFCGLSITRHGDQKLVAAHAANDIVAASGGDELLGGSRLQRIQRSPEIVERR